MCVLLCVISLNSLMLRWTLLLTLLLSYRPVWSASSPTSAIRDLQQSKNHKSDSQNCGYKIQSFSKSLGQPTSSASCTSSEDLYDVALIWSAISCTCHSAHDPNEGLLGSVQSGGRLSQVSASGRAPSLRISEVEAKEAWCCVLRLLEIVWSLTPSLRLICSDHGRIRGPQL